MPKEVATIEAKMAMTAWNFIDKSEQLSVSAPTGKKIGTKQIALPDQGTIMEALREQRKTELRDLKAAA